MYTFGDRLRRLRHYAGYTSRELFVAEINSLDGDLPDDVSCHISVDRLGRIERGTTEALYSELLAFRQVLNVTMECLTHGVCSTQEEIAKLCDGMSPQRQQLFMQFIVHNAEFATQLDCN